MHRAIRSTILLLLILCISLPGLLHVYFEAAQWHVRYQMEESLEREHLKALHLKKNQLFWANEGKELIISGQLFDVHSITYKKDIAIVYGLYDAQETQIKKQLTALQEHERSDRQAKRSLGMQWHHWTIAPLTFFDYITPPIKEAVVLGFNPNEVIPTLLDAKGRFRPPIL